MARSAEGWKLKRHGPTGIYYVRFTIDKERIEYSTGKRTREEASTEAASIYAQAVAGKRRKPKRTRATGNLGEAVVAWLTETEASRDKTTNRSYLDYFRSHLIPFFVSLERISTESAVRYRDMRLRTVKAISVRKELSALRGLLGWLEANELIAEAPIIKGVPRNMTGVAFAVKRRQSAVELSPAQAAKFIAALPERSRRGYPARARYGFQYESGLRGETISQISVPENYTKGSKVLVLWETDDKGRYAREVPLTPKARAWLDSACPDQGLIFPPRDLRCHWQPAAKKALPPEKAAKFNPPCLRAARATHWLERTQNIPAVMHLLGHKHATTTNKYIKPGRRAAELMLKEITRKK